ncbi:MAG: GTP cyclohydrolase II [Emcibacteraceae bacterium]|nr:GTP cyclohydrolase II [Emcibacteraceae bacterium]MDG1996518.1 GTP cyclohydrolase II [Emcibacteraceae bacterium]
MNNNSVNNQKLTRIERAASELRRGSFVVLNDGKISNLLCSAELITDQKLDHIKALSGQDPLIGLTYNRANILKISPRSGDVALVNMSDHMNSGIISSMADPADDLMNVMQGPFSVADVMPTKIHDAGIKLNKIAKLLPAAVFSLPLDNAEKIASEHGLLIADVDGILSYTLTDALSLNIVTSAKVPLEGSEDATMVAFRPDDGGTEHFAILIGNPAQDKPVLTRIHSECFTGDLLGSLKCDCGDQMRGAIKYMADAGGGILLYLAQEGRGIGLINKLRAYHLQDQGFDTVDANERLGFLSDERIFEPAAEMLKKMGYTDVRLLTNNPLKVEGLKSCAIKVTERVEHKFPSNNHNDLYLKTKKKRSGHLL